MVRYVFVFFFFKQKTAYEMRISDWSSDVCSSDLIDFVNSKPALTRLGLAAQLKFFASLGFFAIDPGSIPTDGLSYLAEQLGVEAGEIAGYDFSSRTARRHCAEILIHLGYHRMKR